MGSFKDVVGHKDIIKYIQNAVTADKVSGSRKEDAGPAFRDDSFV